MAHQETFVKRWEDWWGKKKESVSDWWRWQKLSVRRHLKRLRRSWPLYEGLKSPPVFFSFYARPKD
ncbi:hypothetical protein ARMSODRAFT_1089196, partial [Armillaria solidipes]